MIFFINLPIAVAVVAVTWRHVPETKDPDATAPIDVTGGILATLGLIGLTYGVIQGPADGWGKPAVLAALAGGGSCSAPSSAGNTGLPRRCCR